jgi:hypothetical protein
MFLGNTVGAVMAVFLYCMGYANIPTEHLTVIALMIGIVIGSFYITELYQKLYTEEKISTLVPYQNISTAITIVLGFLIFQDTSIAALLIAITTIFIVLAFSIDIRTHSFPRNFGNICLANLLSACRAIAIVYGVKEITSTSYFAFTSLVTLLILAAPILVRWQVSEFRLNDRIFYKNRMLAASIGTVATFMSLFLLQELGLAVTTLLWFLGIGIDLALSYWMLGDVPAKKSVILAVLVTALVGIGFTLK